MESLKTRWVFWLIFTCIVCGLLYLLGAILTPFLTGALLAYLVNPLVNYLCLRWRLPRLLAVIIVFVILFLLLTLLIILFIPLIQSQITLLIEQTGKIMEWGQGTLLPKLTSYFGSQDFVDVKSIKNSLAGSWTKAGGIAAWFFQTIWHSSFALLEGLMRLVLVPLVTFYLLLDWNQFIRGLRNLLPRRIEKPTVKLAKECDVVLSAFFRGQLLVMLALGIFYGVGLTLVGLKIGLIVGLIIGIISIVPYLGVILGILIASIAMYVQVGYFTPVIYVWIVFIAGQILESVYLTPTLVGDRIGLHPVAVIFAVLAGGTLFGFFGVLLALPAAAVIMVCLRFLHRHYQASALYR